MPDSREHASRNENEDKLQLKLRALGERFEISHPSTLQSFIPVVGPAWEAAAEFQDGNYVSAGINGALAVASAVPLGTVVRGAQAAAKGVGVLKKGSVTADASRKKLRSLGVVKPGQEVHHTIPLNGKGRNAQDFRNHYLFLKAMPKEQHRRLTGKWGNKSRYGPVGRAWYGTTDWMKTFPLGLSAYGADTFENMSQRNELYPPKERTRK